MANKCLELGYFPRAWKVAAIKVIPKPGKDDYARPKSYRPIGLPCAGQNSGKDAGRRLQWHLMPKLQATAQLLAYNCPVNLYGMVKGYLRDREVIVRYAGGESRRETSKVAWAL
ncbi:hypothetical protein EVAR_84197_1 [Eumeta japonica]|uniref:RNA-directed DNA polymerase from mobile element jockey n=1 Tax=Eumeta variegata TaxID=151549 RepID=A0A4C1S7T8_EUMVA|nr:hypothetical protein EVAR_84197_1 [Eumeta japonica]